MTERLPSLDPLLHQPARTQLVAFLSARGEASFADLKRALGVTDGNLGAHLNKLVAAGLVSALETGGRGRAQTLYRLTDAGKRALAEYVHHLSTLMDLGTTADQDQPLGSRIREV
ncbi:MAG: transcriptional regulator [Chromatiales bacterium]|nr:transcriptional regulator [Chromatiales bacterium]